MRREGDGRSGDAAKRRLKGGRWLLHIVIVILITVGAAAMIAKSLRNIQKGEYMERVYNNGILMEQMATNVVTEFDEAWAFARYAVNRVKRHHFDDEEDTLDYLKKMEEDSGRSFMFIRKDGHIISTDGIDAVWPVQNLLMTGKEEFYVADAAMFGTGSVATMYYILPLGRAFAAGGNTYTHLILAQRIDTLSRFFSMGDYGDTALTFIIHENGSQIYQKERKHSISRVYNLLALLKNAEYSYGESYDSLRGYISSGENRTVRLKLDGTVYYLNEYHLGISDWVLTMLIPEDTIQAGADNLTDVIIRNIVYIFTAIVLMALLLLGSMMLRFFSQQKAIQRQLRDAAEAERRANSSKTNFLSAMSHDIRTPMNAIVNYTELALQRQDESRFMIDSLKKIKISANHLLTLINDVLDISQVESGKLAINAVPFDVKRMFQEMYKILETRLEEAHVTLKIVREEIPMPYLCGDEVRLKQIYLNILTNAIKYNFDGGQIRVEVTESVDEEAKLARLKFVCEDTGMGMSEEFQKIMYHSFSRETDSRVNKIAGTGLGLAICKQMVEMMNGTIACQSEVNRGTTFTVVIALPIASRKNASTSVHTVERTKAEWRGLLSGLRVLVAEDNVMNWGILELLLSDVGIQADHVKNGKECVERLLGAEEGDYDLVFMDVRMPVMDGREATRRIRASEEEWLRSLPIIALSADAFEEDRQESRRAGMSEHLAKPIAAGVLYHALYTFTRGSDKKEV